MKWDMGKGIGMFRAAIALAALFFAAAPSFAQEANPAAIAAQKEAMQRFEWLRGTWRGPAKGVTRAGPYELVQTERIGPMLDGTVMVIEGKGYEEDGSVPFNAFAVVSYDPATKAYSMRSYALGYSGDFPLTVKDKGYSWQIPAGPNAVIRYHADLSDGTFTEVGDYVAEGQPPRRIFEMKLQRVGDTDWPAAGVLGRD